MGEERHVVTVFSEEELAVALAGFPGERSINLEPRPESARTSRPASCAVCGTSLASRPPASVARRVRRAGWLLWQALREDPASVAQTVMAANAPMLLQRSMVEGNPAEGVMSAGQVAALIGQLDSCQDVIHGIVAQARQRYQQLAPSLS